MFLYVGPIDSCKGLGSEVQLVYSTCLEVTHNRTVKGAFVQHVWAQYGYYLHLTNDHWFMKDMVHSHFLMIIMFSNWGCMRSHIFVSRGSPTERPSNKSSVGCDGVGCQVYYAGPKFLTYSSTDSSVCSLRQFHSDSDLAHQGWIQRTPTCAFLFNVLILSWQNISPIYVIIRRFFPKLDRYLQDLI